MASLLGPIRIFAEAAEKVLHLLGALSIATSLDSQRTVRIENDLWLFVFICLGLELLESLIIDLIIRHLNERSLDILDGVLSSFELHRCRFARGAPFEWIERSYGSSLTLARSECLGSIDLEALSELFHADCALTLFVLVIILNDRVLNHAGLNAMLLLIIKNRVTFAYVHHCKCLNLGFGVGA